MFFTADKLDPRIYSKLYISFVELVSVDRVIIEYFFDLVDRIL